jgi:hypothetical protein
MVTAPILAAAAAYGAASAGFYAASGVAGAITCNGQVCFSIIPTFMYRRDYLSVCGKILPDIE